MVGGVVSAVTKLQTVNRRESAAFPPSSETVPHTPQVRSPAPGMGRVRVQDWVLSKVGEVPAQKCGVSPWEARGNRRVMQPWRVVSRLSSQVLRNERGFLR